MNKWIKYFFVTIAGVIALFLISLFGYVSISSRPFPIGSVVVNVSEGLGNQMFRYAAAYSLAKKTKSRLYVVVGKDEKSQDNVSVDDRKPELHKLNIPEKEFLYRRALRKVSFIDTYVDESNFDELSRKRNFGVLILTRQNFASESFFKNYKEELIQLLTPKANVISEKLQNIIDVVSESNSICVHIRGGDTLVNKDSINISSNKRAMNFAEDIIDNPQYFIFSDSIELVKKELGGIENVSFIHELPFDDFIIMSKCRNNIIDDSTFSWWAAYINKSENHKVISPFRKLYGKYTLPDEWLITP